MCFVHKKFTIGVGACDVIHLFSLFTALVMAPQTLIYLHSDIDEHRIGTEAGYSVPRNDKLFAFSEAEDTAIEKHHDRNHASCYDIYLHVKNISEPLSVAYIDDLLIAHIIHAESFHNIHHLVILYAKIPLRYYGHILYTKNLS